ncbi:phage portal protein [Xanthobacter flavus]|uniref:phage portal protein n=1 Tax=Xanthobacter flavus TaxID=281 RepID=UPI001AEB7A21|nr:phage portal protein [Xanthobacter flavus]MBP2147940.1 lambda family phage portal protein [Xanthobacter flavus]
MTKPRVRVKAGSIAFPAATPAPAVSRVRHVPQARWMRDASTGVLSARRSSLIDNRDDVRRVWDRISGLALDFIQNSGRLKGAVDQVLADTVGTELKLFARPDLARLGYTEKEAADWARMVEKRWRRWAWNPAECDLKGKWTLPQQVDVALRHHVAYGEAVGVIDYLTPAQRAAYGATTGTKFLLVAPHRLVRDTSEMDRLHSGVLHDVNGRPVAYRLLERVNGMDVKVDHAARDADGRPQVVHVFDPWDAGDVRGISVIASVLRTHASAEQLGDATLATAILQTLFAASLTSDLKDSAEAFQAIEALENADLTSEFGAYFSARMDAASANSLVLNSASQVNQLAPGEKLEFHTASTPGSNYIPFAADLRREIARAIGVSYSSFSFDFNGATYSSTRMEGSSIWPVVLRRRERIAAPIHQAVYEAWLDEEIGEGRIPIKGGYRAFRANRDAVCWADWQGPAKPTADDGKSAKAASERLVNGTSSLAIECAELGLDVNDVLAQRAAELERIEALGLPNPFVRSPGTGAPDQTDPADPVGAAA